MDRVRLGRALGYGARSAAKTVAQALDAATSPSPEVPRQAGAAASTPTTRSSAPRSAQTAGRAVAAAPGQARKAAGSVGSTLRHLASTIWLQITGTFFALLALSLGSAVYRARADFRSSAPAHLRHSAYVFAAAFTLFAYFAVTSFLRASRREKRSSRP